MKYLVLLCAGMLIGCTTESHDPTAPLPFIQVGTFGPIQPPTFLSPGRCVKDNVVFDGGIDSATGERVIFRSRVTEQFDSATFQFRRTCEWIRVR